MARWKARVEFLLSVIELLFPSLAVEVLQCKMCQNSLPSGGGRSLGAKISWGRVVPLPIYWYHSKGNWLRYNFAADSFYIMKLCSRLFVLYCWNCPKDNKFEHFIPILAKLEGRSLGAKISGGRGRPWGIFFGFDKTRHILLSDSANCTVLHAVALTQYRHVTDGRTELP